MMGSEGYLGVAAGRSGGEHPVTEEGVGLCARRRTGRGQESQSEYARAGGTKHTRGGHWRLRIESVSSNADLIEERNTLVVSQFDFVFRCLHSQGFLPQPMHTPAALRS
jgi:hypothetical protein